METGKVAGCPSVTGALALPMIETTDDGGSTLSSVPVAGVESTVEPSVRSLPVSVTVNVRCAGVGVPSSTVWTSKVVVGCPARSVKDPPTPPADAL